MKNFPHYKEQEVNTLIPYARNSRTHSAEQVAQIAASIKEFGFTNPVLTDGDSGVIAGHGRLLAAQKLGLDKVPVIELSHLTEAQRKAYIIADNKLALNAGWDEEMLKVEFADLSAAGYDLELTGFNLDEISEIDLGEPETGQGTEDNPYSRKVDAPHYEPDGEKPEPDQIYDRDKTESLLARIQDADLPDDVRKFLVSAAHRHTIFNYEKIANFYAHSDPEIQDLMEDSALIIIDFDKAIADGYVKLCDEVSALYTYEKGEADEG